MGLTPEQKKKIARLKAKRAQGEEQPAKEKVVKLETRINYKKMLEDLAAVKSGRAEFFSFEPGENRLRFLMNPGGDSFYVHRKQVYLPVGGEDGKGKNFISPKSESDDAYCPFDTVANALRKAASESSDSSWRKQADELARRISPRSQWMSNALVKDGAHWSLRIVQFGTSVFRDLVTAMTHLVEDDDIEDDMLEAGNIAHPMTGCIVIVEKSGKKLGTKYAVTITPKKLEVGKDELSKRSNLEKLCEVCDTDEAEQALCEFFGVDDFDTLVSGIDEVDPLPSFDPSSAPVAKKKSKAEVSAKKKHSKAAAEDDDEEDETEDDEEEESESSSDELPDCIGSHGKPKKGLKCSKCGYAKDCKEFGPSDEDGDKDEEEDDEE